LNLAQALKAHADLENLNLSFEAYINEREKIDKFDNRCLVTDDGLENLGKCLKALRNLKALHLNFSQ